MTPERLAYLRSELRRIQMSPCRATLWSYEVSHSILTIRVTQESGELIVLRADACRSICAPTSWAPTHLDAELDESSGDAVLFDFVQRATIRAAILLPEGCDLPGPYDHLQPE